MRIVSDNAKAASKMIAPVLDTAEVKHHFLGVNREVELQPGEGAACLKEWARA